MLDITNEAASAAIISAASEGRLVQREWHNKSKEGRDLACLLGSIHPSVASAADCNGKLMPQWLAELTVTLFDGLPKSEIVPVALRYGGLVACWGALAPAQWERVLKKVLIRCIDEAVDAARPVSVGKDYWPAVEAACAQSKAAIESGDEAAARAAAWAAAEAAARAAAEAAEAAAWAATAALAALAAEAAAWAARAAEAAARAAAWAAARAAAWAAARAAARAAEAAAWAARAAEAAARAATAAWAARAATAALAAEAAEAAYSRLFTFVLDCIEAELA